MAIGARSGAIRRQFLIESITLSLVGGVIGVLFGIGTLLHLEHASLAHFGVANFVIVAVAFSVFVVSPSAIIPRAKLRRWIRLMRCDTNK